MLRKQNDISIKHTIFLSAGIKIDKLLILIHICRFNKQIAYLNSKSVYFKLNQIKT